MDAIETLMNEHRVIERVLDGLVAFGEEVRRKGTTEAEELARFVSFFREFADAAHHGKEEDILFKAMIAHGFPSQGGPVAVMLHEHDQGRALVGVLAARAGQAEPWSPSDRQEIAEVSAGFAGLLRNHIHKEDAILYPMAESHLPPEALAEVTAACDAHDTAPAQARRLEGLVALADALIARHAAAVHPAPPRPRQAGCCG